MECSIPPLTLTKGLMHQQNHLKEAIGLAIKGDMDMSIVAKHNVIFPCHSSLLVLFSPLVARLLSGVPCCPSPTIFLPDFKKIHITKLLHLLESGQALSGQNVNDDIERITEIAKVLQISVNNINIGPYQNCPLGYPFQIKKEVNNFNVTAEIKHEFEALNENQETESLIEKDNGILAEMEQCIKLEIAETEKNSCGGTTKIEVADSVHSEVSFGMDINNDEDMVEIETEVVVKEETIDDLENKYRHEQTEQVTGEVIVTTTMEEQEKNSNGLGFISSVTSLAHKSVSSHSRRGSFFNDPHKSGNKGNIDKKHMKVQLRNGETLNNFNFEEDIHMENDDFRTEIDAKAGTKRCYSNGINKHMNIHTGEKRYSCSYCLKRFKKLSHLNEHTRIHTGEKPFQCEFCPKRFIQSHHLKEHKKIHSVEMPFPCEFCPKRFKSSRYLKVHTKIHTGEDPFPCEFCPKRFKSSRDLKVHTRSHTGDRPFPCELCPKRFKSSSNLVEHTRTHTGEKPFQCGVCPNKFGRSSELKKHTKTHTEPERNISID